LALTAEGMFAEASAGFGHRFDPLTVCAYEVDVEDVVDLRDEASRQAARVTMADLACPWALERAEGRTPASWRIAERLIEAGAAAVLVPSFAVGAAPTAANLVLWKWGSEPPHQVTVYDPAGRLPRDALSWSNR
jgi:RES domain-containing protein